MNFYVYILYSQSKDKYYTGFTHDITTRLFKHNAGATPSTRRGRPWKIVYYEFFATKHEAILRESDIKSTKSRKYIEKLIGILPVG
jgi:putative endonuclease